MTTTDAGILGALLLLFPLIGSALTGLVGQRLGRRFVNVAGSVSILCAFITGVVLLVGELGNAEASRAFHVTFWRMLDLGPGNLSVGFDLTLDQLATVMVLVITGVGFLIHVYSIGYMEHDDSPWRFFSYMNFFVFSMLVLVLSANLLLLIVGWALVALSSYLLIGYDYQRASAVLAARKAFITQVVGDVALVIAAFMIIANQTVVGSNHRLNSLYLPEIFKNASSFSAGGGLITGICVLLAIGAFAKSAQFPLHTWLPDAMEGPTPVSALIHAATMVTAGVYLIARFHPLFDRAPVAQGLVACIGIGTSVMAGIIALSQVDIKRVIAYSTMSQIGLMIYAVGIGAYTAGMYHLVTHAAFKALLFLAAGNVIHALNQQDIRLMGGLKRQLKATAACFLVGSAALAGVPFFAGWFSKENLLGFGAINGPGHLTLLLYALGLVVNILTGLYAFRLYIRVFVGEPETQGGWSAHEAPPVMLVPVVVLAALAAVMGFFLLYPFPGLPHPLGSFLDPVFHAAGSGHVADEPGLPSAILGVLVGTVFSLGGVFAAVSLWFRHEPDAEVVANRLPRLLTQLSLHKFYFDELYDAILVRPPRALAGRLRRIIEPKVMDGGVEGAVGLVRYMTAAARDYQTGFLRDYASYMTAGVLLFVGFVVVVFVRS